MHPSRAAAIAAEPSVGFVPEGPPDDGVLVEGLYLAGARYNRTLRVLQQPRPKQMVDALPAIHFEPVQGHVRDDGVYECPLYKTTVRAGVLNTTGQSTNFVCCVALPVQKGTNTNFWVLQGSALMCALSS